MAHVKISTADEGSRPQTFSIVVDGVEMNQHVLVEGFGVTFPQDEFDTARVHMAIAADVIELDFPEAVIEALRASGGEGE